MTDGTVPERVQDALIKIVATSPNRPCQYRWGGWLNAVARLVPDCRQADVLAVFKLLNGDVLKLTKPGAYSGDQTDDAFFDRGDLNAELTAKGEIYWSSIRDKKKAAIGFAQG
jgi:hypothetical protein